MLKKLTELEVTSEAPFAKDALDRKESIEKLTNLVQSTEQSFVLSVEAPWGWGKTTFIRMWKAHLQSMGHVCLHFNAWENDFVDDPLVAFLGEMKRFVESELKKLDDDDPMKASWEKVKKIGGGVLRKTLPLAVQVATHGIVTQEKVKQIASLVSDEANEVAEFASNLAKERLEKYDSERKGIDAFRLNLEKLAQELATKDGRVAPLVFFIDELDRCKPDFAVALLERVKHLFNVNRIVFVLAVDRKQLNESVRALYGTNADPDGYLRRFIDLAYCLPDPKPDAFADSLFHRFKLEECFGPRHDHARIFRAAFSKYSRCFGLSLRTQEQCFTEINIVLRTANIVGDIPTAALCFLVTLRAFKPGIVHELREGRVQTETVLKWIASVDDEWYRQWAEAVLIVGFMSRDNREARGKVLKTQAESGSEADRQRAEPLRGLISALYGDFYNKVHAILFHLEFASQFH